MTKVLFFKKAFLRRKWRLFSYSSPNDLSCSSWYSNAILSSKASDTSWCNSFMVRATTELFSRISWILHCKARQSLLIPVKETILDIRECSTRGGNWKIKYVYHLKKTRLKRLLVPYRALGRSENPGVPVLLGGHNLTPPHCALNRVLRGHFLGIKTLQWNKSLMSFMSNFGSFWSPCSTPSERNVWK